jgi:CRP/FNR family transcriptional regulator
MNPLTEVLDGLRSFPCLSGLGKDDLLFMGKLTKIKKINRNEVLFEETDQAKFFFVLKSGTVKLYKTSQEGRELVIRIMGLGDYFCCAPLCSGGYYMVRAIAIEDTTLIVIPSEAFINALRNTVSETGWKIITGLCNKIYFMSSLIEDLAFKDVEKRVMATLLTLSSQMPQQGELISFQLSHQDVASMTGTVREVVARTMSKLKKEGVVTHTSVKGFTIDRARLSMLLNKQP